jgi:hypothetical protein
VAAPVTIHEPDESTTPLQRFVDAVWIAPFGVMTRVFGCGVLASGFRRLRQEVDDQVRADRERAAGRRAERDVSYDTGAVDPDVGADGRATAAPSVVDEGDPAPALLAASDLALPDYDHLPASQIVAMLGDLAPDELARIDAYERANRNRRTVLGKLAQLGR